MSKKIESIKHTTGILYKVDKSEKNDVLDKIFIDLKGLYRYLTDNSFYDENELISEKIILNQEDVIGKNQIQYLNKYTIINKNFYDLKKDDYIKTKDKNDFVYSLTGNKEKMSTDIYIERESQKLRAFYMKESITEMTYSYKYNIIKNFLETKYDCSLKDIYSYNNDNKEKTFPNYYSIQQNPFNINNNDIIINILERNGLEDEKDLQMELSYKMSKNNLNFDNFIVAMKSIYYDKYEVKKEIGFNNFEENLEKNKYLCDKMNDVISDYLYEVYKFEINKIFNEINVDIEDKLKIYELLDNKIEPYIMNYTNSDLYTTISDTFFETQKKENFLKNYLDEIQNSFNSYEQYSKLNYSLNDLEEFNINECTKKVIEKTISYVDIFKKQEINFQHKEEKDLYKEEYESTESNKGLLIISSKNSIFNIENDDKSKLNIIISQDYVEPNKVSYIPVFSLKNQELIKNLKQEEPFKSMINLEEPIRTVKSIDNKDTNLYIEFYIKPSDRELTFYNNNYLKDKLDKDINKGKCVIIEEKKMIEYFNKYSYEVKLDKNLSTIINNTSETSKDTEYKITPDIQKDIYSNEIKILMKVNEDIYNKQHFDKSNFKVSLSSELDSLDIFFEGQIFQSKIEFHNKYTNYEYYAEDIKDNINIFLKNLSLSNISEVLSSIDRDDMDKFNLEKETYYEFIANKIPENELNYYSIKNEIFKEDNLKEFINIYKDDFNYNKKETSLTKEELERQEQEQLRQLEELESRGAELESSGLF